MRVQSTQLPGVMLIEPRVLRDVRGYFQETWNSQRYRDCGLPGRMMQDNVSWSVGGVLRGLHYQQPHPQGKLVYVLEGETFDVAVDIRVGSPTFGQWVGERLSAENHKQLYVPEGFAHGFCAISPRALVAYKCTELYRPNCEGSIAWDDPAIGIEWPVSEPLVSAKDATAPRLADVPLNRLPHYVASSGRVHSHQLVGPTSAAA